MKKRVRIWFICVILLLLIGVGIYLACPVPVPLTEITSTPLTDDIFVDPGGTWWHPFIAAGSGDYKLLGAKVHEIVAQNVDFEDETLVIAWGRPLHSVQYRRVSSLKTTNGTYVADAAFENVPEEKILYIYKTQKVRIYDSYTAYILVPPEPVLYSE